MLELEIFSPYVLDNPENIDGAALEGLVAQNLLAWIDYRNKENELYFWRTKAGNEVDFIVYGPNTFIAIEVKKTNKIRKSDQSGLKSFHEDYPNSMCVLLYNGEMAEKHGEILYMPLHTFLINLTPQNEMHFIKSFF